ncbi:opsin 9 isoform X2 [Dicentrarchus labrax]|uniref:opsin 9 isoform X2 n=1 Tax=Dicentrarchus labrax TaxID=13489 RepID=UPI0021F58276|nr:opsin 9 isoform X2 [Dicentrarchus labrax]
MPYGFTGGFRIRISETIKEGLCHRGQLRAHRKGLTDRQEEGVVSLLGNGTVLLVYSRKRKKLRPPELMTINLALCDFGFSLLGAPFFIISSLCHAWVFGETGCLWYGIQGFVFGIGSLLTTCLISVDRCLKICCLRYGHWIERRHVSLSIVLVWVYTSFWATMPAFGFGSYGPEPYGISCTINWWSMRSSLNDRIYIFLILILCFGLPTLTIICSYLAILLTVYRSNRTLASIPSSFVSHTSKDLRLTKIAAVVCATFLVAWLPYATMSLISALIPIDDQEAEGTLQTVMEESTGMAFSSPNGPKIMDIPSLLNWTAEEYYRQIYYNPENKWSEVNNSTSITDLSDAMFRSKAEPMARSPQSLSSLPPVVSLIPAMFAKSHCVINPLIYQIMNREFRNDLYVMVFGQEMAKRRRAQGRKESLYESNEGSINLSYCQSWMRKRSYPMSLSVGIKNMNRGSSSGGRTDSWVNNISVGADALDFESLDTQDNMERHCSSTGGRRDLRGSTASTLTV